MPPEVTAITREPSVRWSSGRSPDTSAKGPTTSVTSVASIPSGPSIRSG